MNLIDALGAAGIDGSQAAALAGAVLGTARTQASEEEADKLAERVPELDEWVAAAQHASETPDEAPQESFLGDLAGFAGSDMGGALLGALGGNEAKEQAQAVAVLSKVGLSASQAALAAPVVLSFLQQRLGAEWTERLLGAAPVLAGLSQLQGSDGASSGIGGLIGGLFD